jgi:hypothetical protein
MMSCVEGTMSMIQGGGDTGCPRPEAVDNPFADEGSESQVGSFLSHLECFLSPTHIANFLDSFQLPDGMWWLQEGCYKHSHGDGWRCDS